MMMARSPLWLMPFGMSKRKTHGVLLKWRPMAYCQNMLAGTCFKLAVFEAAGRPHFAQEIYRGISWVSQSKYTILSKMQTQQQALNTSAGSTDPQPMDIGLMHKGTGCTRAKERATKDKAKERHNGTTKEKDTEDTTTVDMAKAKHKHQLVTAMRSQDQDRNYGSTSE